MNEKLPTAEETLNKTIDSNFRKLFGDKDTDWVIKAIESHTAAQTAALESKYNEAYSSAAKYAEESVRLRERVKELEENLVYAIRAIKTVNSFGATRIIIDDLEKVLKK